MSEVATGIRTDAEIMDGEPVVAGTRVRVATLYRAVEERGDEPETVARNYGVSVADVYRSFAYYRDNTEEMARQERRREVSKVESLAAGAKTLGDLRREHGES